METTRLSSKGQIIIPKAIRQTYQWPVGQEFIVEEIDQGILLRPQKPFSQTQVVLMYRYYTIDNRFG